MIDLFRKLRQLLDKRERRNALVLLLLMLVQALTETAGVASVFPFIALLSDPELIHTNSYLAYAYRVLGFNDRTSFLLFLGGIVMALVLCRIGIAALTSYAGIRYARSRAFTLSTRLLTSYLQRPYAWFLNRHSVDLSKTMLAEVDEVVKGSLMRAFDLIAQLIVASCLISLVLLVQPRATLIALVAVVIAYGLIYRILWPYFKSFGKERFYANRERFQLAHEALGAIKDVKIRGLEYPYLKRFRNVSYRHARLKAMNAVLGAVPRYLLECLTSVGVMALLLMLVLEAGGDLSKALPMVALYAYAILRLLPRMQSIYGNLASMRFNSEALDSIHADLVGEQLTEPLTLKYHKRLPLQESIELRSVCFVYPNTDRSSLRDISLKIRAKNTVGFVGKTGAGKTTLIDVIVGLLEPKRGEVKIDGRALTQQKIREWQQNIGYVPQHIFIADDSVGANIAFGVPSRKIDKDAVQRVCQMAELHTFITDELPSGYDTTLGERGVRLSGGQRQRLGIARALYHDPDVLVLDEATSALDNLTETAVMDAIRNLSHRKTILIIAHRLSTIRACDQLFMLEQGALVATGSYDELLQSHAAFRELANQGRNAPLHFAGV
jgi:ABC-type multidrug transport system fused ATPase/permease subunit